MPGTVPKLIFSNLSKSFPYLPETITNKMPSLHHYSSRPTSRNEASEDHLLFQNIKTNAHGGPPDPIPNRPLRGAKRDKFGSHEAIDRTKQPHQTHSYDRLMRGTIGRREERSEDNFTTVVGGKTISDGRRVDNEKQSYPNRTAREEQRDDESMDGFLEKFKLRNEKQEETSSPDIPTKIPETKVETSPDLPPQEADEIFRKMKETGLIPNAVAMLDGLCKNGLVQEAMKLFGLMREKGTIPEVVIYTAVVEGFCKAHKFDDAKRIFRKMQNNGISPNAFSFTVLIQGLCKGRRLDDAVDFCVEMVEAGHSPNVVTFAGLVDLFCREKGVQEAENVIRKLREKGFVVNEKAVREHLDKKGPFSSLVWEAVFGKKISQTLH